VQAADTVDDLQPSIPVVSGGGTHASSAPPSADTVTPLGFAEVPLVPAVLLAGALVVLVVTRRTWVRIVAVIVVLAMAGVLVVHTVPAAGALVTRGHAAYAQYLQDRPVDALEQYVPLFPGASIAQLVPSTRRWEATTTASVAAVGTFYQAEAHHAGWKVEMSAASGVMLMRHAGGGEERLRIQAFAGSPATRIEYELHRRIP
jgi:hypothetical protein